MYIINKCLRAFHVSGSMLGAEEMAVSRYPWSLSLLSSPAGKDVIALSKPLDKSTVEWGAVQSAVGQSEGRDVLPLEVTC